MSRVGEKIKDIRTKSGMTSKQLAKKLGVAESFITEVEAGRKIINQSLIDRISKVLGKDINDISISFEEQAYNEEKNNKFSFTPKVEKVKEVWNEAFGSILKNVSIYKYDLVKTVGSKQMPIANNKIEGFALDKVLFIEVEDDDMIGFRIGKGDIAFAHITNEVENNAFCLIQKGEERFIRQIKKLDGNKVLLLSNRGTLRTETCDIKELKVIAKLHRLEIKL